MSEKANANWPDTRAGMMALQRIGADTEELSRQLNPPAGSMPYHPIGCLCPECAKVRAAVGKMRGRDKHLAAVMNAKERGKAAAEQAVTGQRRREAAAWAQVTREMAAYGVYPYRMAREEAAAMVPRKPDREPGCGKPGASVMPARRYPCPSCEFPFASPLGSTRCQYCGYQGPADSEQVIVLTPREKEKLRSGTGCICGTAGFSNLRTHPESCRWRRAVEQGIRGLNQVQVPAESAPPPELVLTPEQEIVAALREFDTWALAGPQFPPELQDTGTAPDGTCRECHLGLIVNKAAGLCFWCQLAVSTRNENRGLESLRRHGPDHTACGCRACRRHQFTRSLCLIVLIWAAAMLVILTVFGNLRWVPS
jgi:hypothetical protein